MVDTLAPRETVHPDAHEIQREAMGHVTAYPHVMLIAQENVHVRINGATPQEVVDEVRSLARRLGVAELDSGKL